MLLQLLNYQSSNKTFAAISFNSTCENDPAFESFSLADELSESIAIDVPAEVSLYILAPTNTSLSKARHIHSSLDGGLP